MNRCLPVGGILRIIFSDKYLENEFNICNISCIKQPVDEKSTLV